MNRVGAYNLPTNDSARKSVWPLLVGTLNACGGNQLEHYCRMREEEPRMEGPQYSATGMVQSSKYAETRCASVKPVPRVQTLTTLVLSAALEFQLLP